MLRPLYRAVMLTTCSSMVSFWNLLFLLSYLILRLWILVI
jgi:hypothetical protein